MPMRAQRLPQSRPLSGRIGVASSSSLYPVCGRRADGAAKRGEELSDQVPGHALENALADAGHQAADFALAGVAHDRTRIRTRRKRERGVAFAVAEAARTRDSEPTFSRCDLVE